MERKDRRMERTQTAVQEAFLELLQERDFEKISIRDITERANINRSTFYLHYLDKYDLLQQMILHKLNEIDRYVGTFSREDGPTQNLETIRSLVSHFDGNRSFYKLILQRSSAQYCHALFQEKISGWARFVMNNDQMPADEQEFNVHLVVSAMDGILTWWVMDQAAMSAEQLTNNIAETFFRLRRT